MKLKGGELLAKTILLLEDDDFLRDGLCEMLKSQSYDPFSVSDIASARKKALESDYDLMIFDVMLPDGNGFELCRELRGAGIETPILFLTACDDELQIVRGLDSGADDYVTKPFKLQELLSRVRALLRRSAASVIKSNDVTLDAARMTVYKNGVDVLATKTEFQILAILIKNSGLIVTRDTLLQNIWADGSGFVDDNTLSVHISRLRDKIGRQHIKTVKGVGYRWESAD